MQFCEDGCFSPLPMTEPKTLAYLGWLADERNSGRRSVSASSLAQYLSAVRTMHTALCDTPPADMPSLKIEIRAYARWADKDPLLCRSPAFCARYYKR